MIYKQYNQKRAVNGTAVTETIIIDVTGTTTTTTSSIDGIIDSRPATADELVWLATAETESDALASFESSFVRLDNAANVLRNWASDAASVVSQWDTATTGQKDAWLKATIDRLGKLADNMADVLIQLGVRREIP